MKEHLLIIFGPTAVGKSDYALWLAEQLPAEIVNMDVGQFYTPFAIGTAKPAWRTAPVTHHLFDILDEPQDFSVATYRKRLLETVQDIWRRGKLPILVGGSGFYLKSLLFPPEAATSLRTDETPYQNIHNEELWQQLYTIDPERAQQIAHDDRYRLMRALTIWHETGKLPSHYQPEYKPLAPYTLVHVTRDRDELYDRINRRTQAMLTEGWIDEVKNIQGTEWEDFLKTKKLIGYPEIITFLTSQQHENDYTTMLQTIQQKTRNYAKRQETFWRMLERDIKKAEGETGDAEANLMTINLTSPDSSKYSIQLLQGFKK